MKRINKFISIPLHVWCHADLSVFEKVVLIELDSYSDSNGCTCGVQTISSAIGLSAKEVKETLKSLQSKGAIEVRIDGDGQKRVIPYLYRERYISNPNSVVVGDKPSDVQVLPYDEIAQKWAEICVTLPKITRWSPQRKNKLRSALKQAELGIEDLYKVFRIIACTPFLSGESNQFQCSFEWLISKSSNLEKVYTGFYSRSYAEKSAYSDIMNDRQVSPKNNDDEYYR